MANIWTYPPYSRAERLSDAVIHLVGVSFGLVGASLLIGLTLAWSDEPRVVWGSVVYGLCMVAMLGASAIYHMTPREQWRDVLRRVDHSAIYVKIAGTYTPFALFSGSGFLLTATIWLAAAAGALLRICAPGRFVPLAIGLYLGMGWVGVIAGGDLIAGLEPAAVVLIAVGGLIYTFGVAFFLWERLPFHNTIWHAFVLVATVIFYAAVMVELSVLRII